MLTRLWAVVQLAAIFVRAVWAVRFSVTSIVRGIENMGGLNYVAE